MTNTNLTAENTLKVVYGDTQLDVAVGTPVSEIKNAMQEIFPELKNAEVVQEGNVIKFSPKAGTKGADDMLKVVYGDTQLDVAVGTPITEIQAAMQEIFPELKNANVNQEGNTITFSPKAGTKGMAEQLKVVYGDTQLDVDAATPLAEIKTAMSEIFPELKNATVTQEGNIVRFAPKAGTKGMAEQLKVVYGDTQLDVDAATPIAEIKNAMAEIFPELKNATVTQEGNVVRFAPKAGTKGMAEQVEVVYGDTVLNVDASTPLTEIKSAMSEIFPELKNATVTQEGNTIRFAPKAGTKGADQLKVVYGDTQLDVDASTPLEEIKVAMSEIFPELKNATVTQEGNTVRFAPKAGTKGTTLA